MSLSSALFSSIHRSLPKKLPFYPSFSNLSSLHHFFKRRTNSSPHSHYVHCSSTSIYSTISYTHHDSQFLSSYKLLLSNLNPLNFSFSFSPTPKLIIPIIFVIFIVTYIIFEENALCKKTTFWPFMSDSFADLPNFSILILGL